MNGKCLKSKLTRAFSLIELMVVIAIVALLTAIAVPSYQGYLQQSKVTEIFSLASDQMSQWAQKYNSGATGSFVNSTALGSYVASTELYINGSGSIASANCTTNGVSGALGVVCVVLNANAGTIDASLASITLRFVPALAGTVGGDTTDTTLSWACSFKGSSNGTTAGTLLAPGNCGTANGT